MLCQAGPAGRRVLHLLLLRVPVQLHPVGDHRDPALHAAAQLERGEKEHSAQFTSFCAHQQKQSRI
jgi:hypothetical protein